MTTGYPSSRAQQLDNINIEMPLLLSFHVHSTCVAISKPPLRCAYPSPFPFDPNEKGQALGRHACTFPLPSTPVESDRTEYRSGSSRPLDVLSKRKTYGSLRPSSCYNVLIILHVVTSWRPLGQEISMWPRRCRSIGCKLGPYRIDRSK